MVVCQVARTDARRAGSRFTSNSGVHVTYTLSTARKLQDFRRRILDFRNAKHRDLYISCRGMHCNIAITLPYTMESKARSNATAARHPQCRTTTPASHPTRDNPRRLYFRGAVWDLIIFFTSFASSIRKARRMLTRTSDIRLDGQRGWTRSRTAA